MISQHHQNRISRRRFLQGVAMLGGATALAACTPPQAGPAEAGEAASEGAKILLRLNGIDAPGQEFADDFIISYNADNNVNVEIDYIGAKHPAGWDNAKLMCHAWPPSGEAKV